MNIRKLVREDFETVRQIIIATDVFNKEEVDIAVELLEIYLSNPHQQEYEIFVSADDAKQVTGYICIGPTPATVSTYDMYWIAVSPSVQAHGVGSELLRYTEEFLKQKGATLLIAETSSTAKYEKTRSFYVRKGFEQLAHIKAYYKPDDDLIIYGKYLSQ